VALPLLALLFAGTVDFGRVFYKTMAVTQAARAGAQYGSSMNGYDITEMEAQAMSAGSDITGLTVAASYDCTCYNGGSESVMVCNSGTCPTGQNRVYVTVTANATFTTVMNYPGIPNNVPIVRAARMRFQ
jgi:Flp pilus assembly protein TadG